MLIVEDEPDLRSLLAQFFSREGHAVTAVADGHAALEHAGPRDVILLDVALGRPPDGIDVCRTLRAEHDVVPIIMVTALGSEADAVLGLEAGADDYVTKPFGMRELRSRIRAVLRRTGARAVGERLVAGELVLDIARRELQVAGATVALTFTEFELVRALFQRPGTLRTRQELLRAIWGDTAYRDPRAIDAHVRRLREKLGEPSPIVTVRGAGYRLEVP
jgi:DNA-binding response OmpR family regulator